MYKSHRSKKMSSKKRRIIFEKTSGFCFYCGTKLLEKSKLRVLGTFPIEDNLFEIDHIIPISKGGSERLENLMPPCPKCNRKKGNKTLEEYKERKAMNHLFQIKNCFKKDQIAFLEKYGFPIKKIKSEVMQHYFFWFELQQDTNLNRYVADYELWLAAIPGRDQLRAESNI